MLEDGRRGFKTRDGPQVFDGFGEDVGRDVVAPEDTSDDLPHWKDFSTAMQDHARLEAERQKTIEYQKRLDEARTEIDDGEISGVEPVELDAKLSDLTPPAIQMHMPGMTPEEPALSKAPTRPDQAFQPDTLEM